jgi:hypothetical protein
VDVGVGPTGKQGIPGDLAFLREFSKTSINMLIRDMYI